MTHRQLAFSLGHVLAVLIALALGAAAARAEPTIWDNGSISGTQDNLRNSVTISQRLYEDFVLGANTVLKNIYWSQHDHNGATYNSTEITIYAGLPQVGTLVYSATIVATRTANTSGSFFTNWDVGYDYAIEGLTVNLPAGTYWIGINQNHTGQSPGWDVTAGGPDTIPDSRVINFAFPPPGDTRLSRAFRLEGIAASDPQFPPTFDSTTLVLPPSDPEAQAISCGSAFDWPRGRTLVIDVVASDANSGDRVSMSATSNGGALPTGATFLPVGAAPGNPVTYRLTWTPEFTNAAVDQSYEFVFTATDGDSSSSDTTCQINVDVNKDRDGDSIPDLWELEGVPGVPDTDPCHLPSLGADVNQRDMFVEIDYLVGYMPSTQAIDKVKTAFAAYGIHLHVCVDDAIPLTSDLEVLGSGSASSYNWQEPTHPSGAADHFQELKDLHFDPAVNRVFRYCIYAKDLPGTASGVARGNGSQDFIVALGSFSGGVIEEAGTLMHELGHTLGLTHGGLDGSGQADLAWKPNYSSVMSYWYQRYGVGRNNGAAPLPNDPLGRTSVQIDFSPFALPELDERALNETAGLGPNAAGYKVRWMCGAVEKSQANGSAPIDWNCSGAATETSVLANVSRGLGPSAIDNNFQPAFGSPGGTPGLLGHDDWAALDFSGGGTIGAGDGGPPPPAPPAVTPLVELDVPTAANIKPPAPTGLVARAGRGSVRLRWNISGPLGDFTYNVYRGSGGNAPTLLASTQAAGYIDRRPPRGVLYTYHVTVVDTLSGESLLSTGVQVTAR